MGKAFNFNYIVFGNINKQNDKITAEYKIFNGKNGKIILAEQFTDIYSMKNIFYIQSKIVSKFSTQLGLSVHNEDLNLFPTDSIDSFEAFSNGLNLYQENNMEDGYNYFLKSIQSDGEFLNVYKYLNLIGEKLSKTDNLKKYYENKLISEPENPFLMNYLGNIYFKTDKDKAQKLYKKAIELSQTYGSPYENLGTVYAVNKDYLTAIEEFEKALEYSDRKAQIYYKLGLCYIKVNDEINGKKYFSKALEIEPKNPEFTVARKYLYGLKVDIDYYEVKIPGEEIGEIYINSEPVFKIESDVFSFERAKAITGRIYYIISKKIKPSEIKVCKINNQYAVVDKNEELIISVTGDMVWREGVNPKELVSYYYEILQMILVFPENFRGIKKNLTEVAPYMNLGNEYYSQNNLDKAEEQYREAIKINPSCGPAHYSLGVISLEEKDYQNAITYFYNAIKNDCSNVKAYIGLGKAYRAQGNSEEAEKSFSKALELDPGNSEVEALLYK